MQKPIKRMPETKPDRPGWKQDPQAVRDDILRVATEEFAAHGLSGARMGNIAAKTRTSKRMIYYYFGDKEGLYGKVLEAAYAEIRQGETHLELAGLSPMDALAELVSFTFDHHCRYPDFVRLVMIENIHHAGYLKHSKIIRELNRTAIEKLEEICSRGIRDGVFRSDIDALKLHWQISGLAFFNVSNRPTFSAIFGDQLWTAAEQQKLRQMVVDTILRFAQKTGE